MFDVDSDEYRRIFPVMVAWPVERILVVEDCRAFSHSVCSALGRVYRDVRACESVSEVEARILDWWPDLVLLDVILADGDAYRVLDLLERRDPAPVVIVMSGVAGPAQSFELAARGVRAFLEKPLRIPQRQAAIDRVLEATPDLRRTDTPLVVDTSGTITVNVRAQGATVSNNVVCELVASDSATFATSGPRALPTFGSPQFITLTNTAVFAGDSVFVGCDVSPGGTLHTFLY